jgi:chromosome segregation ATPase
MSALLTFAAELERRDADVAQALDAVERLQAETDELRAEATAVLAFLDALPAVRAERAADERAAADAHDAALAAVRNAEALVAAAQKEEQRLEASRALQKARDDLHAAEFWLAQSQAAQAELEQEGAARRATAERLERRAAELAPSVRDVPAPGPGLAGAVDWASRARGALILERAALARKREEIVREAIELLASVVGEPLAAASVADVRERLARALATSSS